MIKAKTHHRCVIRFTDKILLIGILTTFLILVASNTPQSFAAEFFKLGGVTVDSVEQNNQVIDTTVTVVNETHFIEENITTSIPFTVKPETDLEIDYNIYKTRNGLEFGLGSVYNSGNEKNITVKIFNEDDEIYVNITMKKNGTWNFGKIKDMLIVPLASNLIINPLNTSYYESVNQLRISLNSTSNEDEFLVYTKQRPNRVVADVSTKWNYDYDTKILKISLLSSSEHFIIVDWTY